MGLFSGLHHSGVDVHRTHASQGWLSRLCSPAAQPSHRYILVHPLPVLPGLCSALGGVCGVFFKILQNMSATVAPLPQPSLRVRTRKVTRMAVAICLAFFTCWAPYYILQLAHLGVQRPTFAFLYAYNIAISMGYANSCINPFIYIVLSDTFKRKFIVAIRPSHRTFRVAPALADGSMCLRMAPDSLHPSHLHSSRELLQNMLPVTVAVH